MRLRPQRCCHSPDSTVFLKLRWKSGVFLKLHWIQSHVFWTATYGASREVGESRLKLRWKSQSGTPQPSLDIDANRLVLLDRAENGDNGHSEDTADIPF